jgi:EAL domain-containing protein (putative c-di-GMP-specific phosphodiesterase class I)/DNA-binding NarL/FixJ family response regulator
MTASRVLVVDDAPEVRAALNALIAAAPELELVGTAADIGEAASLAHRYRPDVALVDVKMPGGGGPQATAEIIHQSPQTRVVAFSAHNDRSSIFAMLKSGAVSYLVKGATAEEIKQALASAARGESILSPEVAGEIVQEFAGQLTENADRDAQQRELVARVRQALQPGGLEIVFQPIVELATRTTIGFEALTRFPQSPLRPPDEWFADAKAVALSIPLETAALQIALASTTRLPPDTFLSINLDPNNLITPSILEILNAAPTRRIVIELTEHTPVDDYASVGSALLALRAQGLRIAVDDAGAGFASLRHIVQLAPDLIKLDTSLIHGLTRNRTARAVIAALVAFAKETNITVVAEGIENEQAAALLGELGVRYGQGYLLGRPGVLKDGAISDRSLDRNEVLS